MSLLGTISIRYSNMSATEKKIADIILSDASKVVIYTVTDLATAADVSRGSVVNFADWRQKEDIFEVPFRTLYNGKIRNMLTAGRSISVTDALWDLSRVIPVCVVTGEAAGIAAAISNDFTNLDVADIQKVLRSRGVPLHESELDLT